MANQKNIEMKAAQVSEVQDKIQRASSVVAFDYRGLTVEEVTQLRNEMRKAGVEYVVLKNHIVGRACDAAGVDPAFHEVLHGPSAFAFGYDDAVTPAKLLKEFVKKVKKCEIKGGIVEGAVTMVDQALRRLENDDIVAMDDERRAQMVSNLLVVLCSDQRTQPVVNTGSLYA